MTFLIVDDHPINLMLIENFLSQYSVKIIQANNGMEAWLKWNEHAIDVLISDHYMPLMDGLDLIKKIKQSNHKDTLCVLITGENNIMFTDPDYVFIKPIIKQDFDKFMSEILIDKS